MADVQPDGMYRSISGRIGTQVFFRRYGRQYMRRYCIPANPHTELQESSIHKFAEASKAWRSLTPARKERFNMKATLSVFNLFVSIYMKQQNYVSAQSAAGYHEHFLHNRSVIVPGLIKGTFGLY